ncbi:unnamed protein product [Rhizophagus irregularis]|nr:unnamed protein product [Rhizophagus irregularis]
MRDTSNDQKNRLNQNFINWTSGNEQIDNFIKKLGSKIEWIPYNQFNDFKEISKNNSFILYSIIWKDGPRYDENKKESERTPNKKVVLKYLCNSQNNINEFLYKVKKYLRYGRNYKIYGISQNPNTENYIMVLNDYFCKTCGKIYTDVHNEWCIFCQINDIEQNFANWTSGNEKVDETIQEMQLKIGNITDIIFKWVPYGQFINIKKIGESTFTTVHSAIWTDGVLKYNFEKHEWERKSNKRVTLKCLYDLHGLKEINSYTIAIHGGVPKIYGITQNPDTNDYVMILQGKIYCEKCGDKYTVLKKKWCKPCQINDLKQNFTNWTSGNEKIDEFIQEMQLKIESINNRIVEWIPYNQFNDIKKIGNDDIITIYTAVWINGPLEYRGKNKKEQERIPNEKVILKYLYNSQNNINEFLNELKLFLNYRFNFPTLCGVSQNPDTKEYIIVHQDGSYCKDCAGAYTNISDKWCKPCQISVLKKNFANWTSGNEKIDEIIQEGQLKIETYRDRIIEWISYDKFKNINEIRKDDFAELYSAIWKDGELYYDRDKIGLIRFPDNKVMLKRFYNSRDITNEFFNEVKSSINKDEICGISQNPTTEDYIIVYTCNNYCQKCGYKYITYGWCKTCYINNLKYNFTTWTSGNKKVDEFIQEMQLNIKSHNDVIFEWVPYNQFNDIKEIHIDDFTTVRSAIWTDGPLCGYKYILKRNYYKKVALKCLHNSRNNIIELLNEVKLYSINKNDKSNIKIYGISQDPDTKDYIMVFQDSYCEKCGKTYANANARDLSYKWCNPCHIDNLKQNFTNWTSGNEKIDNFIQTMQSAIRSWNDIIIEWIPYNQFNDIKEIGKGGFATVNLAIWIDGPLKYNKEKREWDRIPNQKVALKRLHNSQNITRNFLSEVKAYSTSYSNPIDNNPFNSGGILKIYGISQNPVTKDYIIVLQYANEGNFENYKDVSKDWYWFERLYILRNIIKGLEKIHEIKMVHRDFHTGNILMLSECAYNTMHFVNNVCISDMGLCGEVGNMDETRVYGVMPYMAPEILRGKPYTQAADIYSFGMIMYFVATGRQPFNDCAHDQYLALNICDGIRPEINEQGVPKFYIDLMKKCWDSNPENRPTASEIDKLIDVYNPEKGKEITEQNDEADEYRKANLLSIENSRLTTSTHPRAYYTSRLLNPFTKDLPKHDSECLDCLIDQS